MGRQAILREFSRKTNPTGANHEVDHDSCDNCTGVRFIGGGPRGRSKRRAIIRRFASGSGKPLFLNRSEKAGFKKWPADTIFGVTYDDNAAGDAERTKHGTPRGRRHGYPGDRSMHSHGYQAGQDHPVRLGGHRRDDSRQCEPGAIFILRKKRKPISQAPFKQAGSIGYDTICPIVSGISSHVRPSSRRPVFFLFTPPHCLKKNGTPASRH